MADPRPSTSRQSRLGKLAGKSAGQLRLLRRNPEEFVRNIRQFTNPPAFLAGLLDMTEIPPLRIEVETSAGAACSTATLNILLPSIGRNGMTGGPNTVLMIGARLAHGGIPVRFVSCDVPLAADKEWFWAHLAQLTGIPGRPARATLDHACAAPLRIGADDLFLASFWTTAHQAAAVLPRTRRNRFVYLIQDFEPGFYAWSSRYAMAMATLDLPFHAVINEATLADFLFESRIGKFADGNFRSSCTVFEPAIDRRLFQPVKTLSTRPRRLLVYARPTNPRNLLGMAVAALKQAVAGPPFAGKNWEFLAIGARGSLPPIPLGEGRVLLEAPWRDLASYAGLLQTSDILMSPMLSPHTGYPVLEMAACGGVAVTNSFATKTPTKLMALSSNIIAVDATTEGFAIGLAAAAERVATGVDHMTPLRLPNTWDVALDGVQQTIHALVTDDARM
jgi:O-antigen biosynthesis protein